MLLATMPSALWVLVGVMSADISFSVTASTLFPYEINSALSVEFPALIAVVAFMSVFK